MLCERPYLRVCPQPETDVDAPCFGCDGHGYRRWFDAVIGWAAEGCHVCNGVSTAGVFVVRVFTAKFQYELRFQTDSLAKAKARAKRFAELAHRYRMLGCRATEVKVLFLTTPPAPDCPPDVVARFAVRPPSLTPTAA